MNERDLMAMIFNENGRKLEEHDAQFASTLDWIFANCFNFGPRQMSNIWVFQQKLRLKLGLKLFKKLGRSCTFESIS